jgi:PAS domain-containing protein
MGIEQIEFPPSFFAAQPDDPDTAVSPGSTVKSAPNLQMLTDQVLLQNYTPAAVLVNCDGDILYVSGRTGKYLELAAGKVNWNIFAMAREGLRYELGGAFQKALRDKKTVTIKDLVVGINGGIQSIDLTIQPQKGSNSLQGTFLVVFQDVPVRPLKSLPGKDKRSSAGHVHLALMEQELQHAREEAQTIREEMRTSQEELQSTNEELQSTNEELTTSKEEMQSMNEELQTVNNELQSKVEDLTYISNDMKNLMNSTDIATLFLDDALCVRSFTSHVTKIIKLIPADAGRPITDIVSDLVYPELSKDVQEVLRSLVFIEKQVAASDGRWFTVRIMPYRTMDNRIDGVVITFLDITIAKQLEAQLRENEWEMKALFKHMTNVFVLFETVLEADGSLSNCRFSFINAAFERMLGIKNEDVQGKLVKDVWAACDETWIRVSGQVALTGAPEHIEINNLPTGKRYNCNIYRPGESQNRICMILDEIRE